MFELRVEAQKLGQELEDTLTVLNLGPSNCGAFPFSVGFGCPEIDFYAVRSDSVPPIPLVGSDAKRPSQSKVSVNVAVVVCENFRHPTRKK